MRYRHAYIEDNKVLADSGTEVIDIRVTDPITELLIRVSATNVAARNEESPIKRCVSKIEIVDGSDVLYSLSGHQAIALAFYDTGKLPASKMNEWVSNSQEQHWPISFGRFMGDPVLAFDPTKFTNPQLKITWNLAAINTIDSDGFVADSGRLTVIATIMEEMGGAPTGFLMNKEHYSWTTAASGDETIDLPTDYPYRKILVRSYEGGVECASAITDLRLSVDQGKFIPFDLHTADLARMMEDWFGKAMAHMQVTPDDGDTREVWMDMEVDAFAQMEEGTAFLAVLRDSWAGRVSIDIYNNDGTEQTVKSLCLLIRGRCVESCFCYPFGRQDLIEEAFKAPGFGSIRLVASQENVNGAASVVLQQIRNY